MRRNGLSIFLVALVLIAVSAALFIGNVREREHQRLAQAQEHDRIQCASNLRMLGLSMLSYAHEHDGKLPDSLEALFEWDKSLRPEAFLCPRDARGMLDASPERAFPRNISFVYLGNGLSASSEPAKVISLEERQYHADGVNVLYSNGRVEYMDLENAMKIQVPPRYPLPTMPAETTQPSMLPLPEGAGSAGTSR